MRHARFKQLYTTYYPKLRAGARSLVGEGFAQDVLHDVYITVVQMKRYLGVQGSDIDVYEWLKHLVIAECNERVRNGIQTKETEGRYASRLQARAEAQAELQQAKEPQVPKPSSATRRTHAELS